MIMTKSIAVAGKGGTGKTTISALLIGLLCEKGMGPVLAIDADPDSNLGTLLGIEVHKTIGKLREEILEDIKNFPPGMDKANYIEAGFQQIIEEANGFDLLSMGRGEGSGCYCYLNTLIRKFSEGLFPSYRWIVMDNEAGLEHISRRTTSNIDALIVVVTGNPVSLNTAKSIQQITEELKSGIKKKYVVTNMVKESYKKRIQNWISELDMEYLIDIPEDTLIEEAIFNGKPITSLNGSPAKKSVNKILDIIGGDDGNT